MSSTNPDTGSLDGLHLLVIEDDPVFSFQLTTFLQSRSARVSTAADGETGLSLAGNTHPDLILTDLGLPGLQGDDLLKLLIKLDQAPPLIVISARGSMSDVSSALRLGARDYLIKPVDDWSSLVRSILDLVNPKRTQLQDFTGQMQLELARTEFADHREYFASHDMAASQLFQTLQSSSPVQHSGMRLSIEPRQGSWSSEVIDLQDKLGFLLCEFSMVGRDSAIAAAIIRHLLNEPYRGLQEGEPPILLRPSAVLQELNENLCQAQLPGLVNAVYAVIDRHGNLDIAMAGLRPSFKSPANRQIVREVGERQDPALGMLAFSTYQTYNVRLNYIDKQLIMDFATELKAEVAIKVEASESSMEEKGSE